MTLDLLCRVAEGYSDRLATKLRYASLLRIPDAYRLDLVPPEELDANARLIWPAVIVEQCGLATFIEREGRLKPGGGIDPNERRGTTCIGIQPGDVFSIASAHRLADRETKIERTAVIHVYLVVAGMEGARIRATVDTETVRVILERASGALVDGTSWVTAREQLLQDLMRQSIFALHLALAASTLSATPGNWVVKHAPSKIRDPRASPKIPRSHQRPHWLLITDEERVRYFRNEAPAKSADGKEVTPHPRRAHYRHIGENEDGSKKYTWVRACWVGSTEAEIRGARYKVELDL